MVGLVLAFFLGRMQSGAAVSAGGDGGQDGKSGARHLNAAAGQRVTPVHLNSYTEWRDPGENAFTVSLPRGWQISGGTVRNTIVEPHYVIHAQSPDGGVEMFFDDPAIALREVPNAMTAQMGLLTGRQLFFGHGRKSFLRPKLLMKNNKAERRNDA